jgi:hypothetical protein
LEYEDFEAAKRRLIERAEKFGEISLKVLFFLIIKYLEKNICAGWFGTLDINTSLLQQM